MEAIGIKINGLHNPIGIDEKNIKLSWNLINGIEQTAYEIVAAYSEEKLNEGEYIWTSEKVYSKSMTSASVDVKLYSRMRLYLKIRVWDENDDVGCWSENVFFEMGLLNKNDWKANWITGNYKPVIGQKYPADYFRKNFSLSKRPVSARLYSSACGVYVCHLNNKKVGEDILAPGRFTYEKRVIYQTYDVTELVKQGDNTWNILLGDGWYRGKCGAFGASYVFGDTTAFLGQLEIVYEDGSREDIITDSSFDWSNDGPIRMNDMKDCGIIDFNYKPSFSQVSKIINLNSKLCCSNNVGVREKEYFTPTILLDSKGNTILDFGQNIAGYMKFKVTGETGKRAHILFGEMLDENNDFTNSNLVTLEKNEYIPDYNDDSHFQDLELVFSGKPEEFCPQLTVQGFRYALLIDWPETVRKENFVAIAVYSDVDYLLEFHSSDKEIEKLVENTKWSIKGNFLDVPTDCPTRERAAWLGDAQLFFDTSCWFIDGQAFYKKWIRDVFDDQAANGMVYNIVPRVAPHEGVNIAVEGSSGWCDAGILIPYRYYKMYKDTDLIKELYPKMKALLDFITSRLGDETNPDLDKFLAPSSHRKYIVTSGFHFGEWNEPDTSIEMVMAPKFEVATAYAAYSLNCMSELAKEIGEKQDAQQFKDLAGKVIEAYRFYFVNQAQKMPERMCEFVRPLALNLLEENQKKELADGLKSLVEKNNYHVGTGFLSTPFLLPIVGENVSMGHAWKMLENREYPSWISEVEKGATTIWENWDGIASRNHYSNGAVCDWIVSSACGINVIGENSFEIKPNTEGQVKSMGCRYNSLYGPVACFWEKINDSIHYEIEIPAGTEAYIKIPKSTENILKAGKYDFIVKM